VKNISPSKEVNNKRVYTDISMGNGNQHNMNANTRPDIEAGTNIQIDNQLHNQIKLLLFHIHIIINIILSISLIVFICQ
jgi:hypothetical protein